MVRGEKATFRRRLGFIGIGYLGSRIARRLLDAGFSMVVYDRNPSKTGTLATLGAEVAQSPEKLASEVDVILSCLANDAAVEGVYLGTSEVLRNTKPGTQIMEMSTISPETSRRLYQAARQSGVSALDVAISGSTPAADREVFEAATPIFRAIASQWFYMGSSGSGVAMKLVVNTLLGVAMQAVAEAVALGSRLDLPRDLVLDTLAKTAVVAPALTAKLASAKKDDYTPQFAVRLMHKDFGLILAAASQFGLSMPATEAAAAINSKEAASGIEEDFSAVVHRMEGTG